MTPIPAVTVSGALSFEGVDPMARPLDYSAGFADTSALQANDNGLGVNIFTGSLLRLTDGRESEASSVFTRNRVNVAAFATSFTFNLHSPQVWQRRRDYVHDSGQ